MATLSSLQSLGQAVWLDFISRELMASGELARRVGEGLHGLTSNPAIFEKAVAQGGDYARQARELALQGLDAKAIYERMAISDIRAAADALRPVYDSTRAADGYVSLEVSPTLAHDTAGTLEEARRLWREVDRPNLMIKVPGTAAGAPAIRDLIADGINVNVTLLFSQAAYREVAAAWLAGLQARHAQGKPVNRVASVASFFVSRIDTAVDAQLEAKIKTADGTAKGELEGLRGKAAIANARLAYRHYQDLVSGASWKSLAAAGAQPQRLLWASTSCKNPAYRDVVYVEELIGADTVNTLPPATLDAFVDHGVSRVTISEGVEAATRDLALLSRHGVSLDAVTAKLLDEGVRQFEEAFEKLLGAVKKQTAG